MPLRPAISVPELPDTTPAMSRAIATRTSTPLRMITGSLSLYGRQAARSCLSYALSPLVRWVVSGVEPARTGVLSVLCGLGLRRERVRSRVARRDVRLAVAGIGVLHST